MGQDHTRKRTGCQACRTRRIRCDERKPTCRKCETAGLKCPGFPLTILAHSGRKEPAFLISTNPGQQTCFKTASEQSAFHFFRLNMLHSVPGGFFDAQFWNQSLLRLSLDASKSALRYAIIALGEITRCNLDAKHTQRTLAYSAIGQSITTLRMDIVHSGSTDAYLLLVLCGLFVFFEFRSGDLDSGRRHLQSGLEILRKLQAPDQQLPSTVVPPALLSGISVAFRYFEWQLFLLDLNYNASFLEPPSDTSMTLVNEEAMRFDTLAGAKEGLHANRFLQWHLVQAAGAVRMSKQPDQALRAQSELKSRWNDALLTWEKHFQRLYATIRTPAEKQAADRIEVQQLVCKISTAEPMWTQRQVGWDDFLPVFRRICEVSEIIIQAEKQRPVPFSSFGSDTGLSAPLHLTIIKCRDPKTRRRAIYLLQQCLYQEGMCSGPQLAELGAKAVWIEEHGIVGITRASDIPEHRRISNTRHNMLNNVVTCTRCRFEVDGRPFVFHMAVPENCLPLVT